MEQINSTTIFDTDILGTIDSNGNLKTLYDKEAMKNSLIGWLTSFKNDIIRSPGRAGYLTSHLFKPMTETNRKNIFNAITDGLYQDYFPRVVLNSLEVVPDYEHRYWNIYLNVYVNIIKDTVEVNTTIKNLI